MTVQIKRELIKNYLVQSPKNREDDHTLIANIWYKELKAQRPDIPDTHLIDMLSVLAEGKLTNPETIRRTRQKVQEENPELRGRNYKARKTNQEKITQQL